jgi:hypothetical protein
MWVQFLPGALSFVLRRVQRSFDLTPPVPCATILKEFLYFSSSFGFISALIIPVVPVRWLALFLNILQFG